MFKRWSMCCVLFLMERFDDDTGPSGLSTAQWTRFVEVGDQRVQLLGRDGAPRSQGRTQ
jgi:hypothetical protein